MSDLAQETSNTPDPKRQGLNFTARLVLFTAALIVMVVGLSSLIVYRASQRDLTQSLGQELLAASNAAATLIDANPIPLIYRDDRDSIEFFDEFEVLREQLDRIRRASGLPELGNPIYIMRPTTGYLASGELEFVVMPDLGQDGQYFVGNTYPSQPRNRLALSSEASASDVYEDEEGVWIFASSPLYDGQGELVGLLQLDRSIDFFYLEARHRALEIAREASDLTEQVGFFKLDDGSATGSETG